MADANFLVGDEVDEPQARGIGQGAKKRLEREGFFFSGHASNYIWLDRYVQPGIAYIHTHKRIY